MSLPAPDTTNVSALHEAPPATAGAPTSCDVHGLGSDAAVTVKATALLAAPPTVTTTGPVVALAGTGTLMLFADHVLGVAATRLKVTVLVPTVAPKLLPLIVTVVPTAPLAGVSLVMVGDAAAVTVKATALLAAPPTVTTTGPVVAVAGTGAMMLVAGHALGVAPTPLKVMLLVPTVAPKLLPLIVTVVPTAPLVGVSAV